MSTPAYYTVCRDLIDEVIALFDGPRFFHLGMDEETIGAQAAYAYIAIRQHELWWNDLLFLTEQVQHHGVRPWIWSDYAWQHADTFYQRMPRSVIQSNWYYGAAFDHDRPEVQTYQELNAHGYDQIPTASNWTTPESLSATINFCAEHIAPEHLLGFLQTSWKPMLEECRAVHLDAIKQLGQAKRHWNRT